MADDRIPLLTDTLNQPAGADAAPPASHISEADIELLRSKLTKSGLVLIERLLATMLKELESTLADRLRHRARRELPILIDTILKEQLSNDTGETEKET